MDIPENPIPLNFIPPAPSTRVYLEPPANKLLIPKNEVRPACRFVMISGMPVMVSNDKIKQLFDHCGPIIDIWKNHLNNCYLEFATETASSNAVLMTGFSVVIDSGIRFTSQLNINYALEHEVKQAVIPFSDTACKLVSEKLSDESTLSEGTDILTKWMKNGECNRETADQFFSLIKFTNAAADLPMEKIRRMNEAENKLNTAVDNIADYLSVLDQVFNHANFNTMLASFPAKEREDLIQWKREFEEAKVEINHDQQKKGKNKKNKRSAKKKASTETITTEELLRLRQEKEDLELQLDVANLALVNDRIEQQQEIDALKKSVFEAQNQCAEYEAQLADWRIIHAKLQRKESETASENKEGLSNADAKMLTELSTYLGERLGATLSDIRTHLRRKDFHCTAKSIALLMRKFPALFREESVALGTTTKNKWVFIGCRS